jgi:hypothetical protein
MNPFVGTWKLNPAKAKYKSGAPPQEATATISQSGSDLDIALKVRPASGAPISAHYTVPENGGTGKIIESSSYDAVSAKRLNANERETSYSKGGKVVLTVRTTVSKDGKTLNSAVKGTDPAGQVVDGTSVYEKQ